MTYLRTPEEIIEFCNTNNIKEISVNEISNHVETNLDLSFLGYFQSMLDDSFYTYSKRGGHKTQDNKFGAETKVLDFLLNSRIFSDTSGENSKKNNSDPGSVFNEADKIVKLFGKMESGKIIELFALNTGNYFETAWKDKTSMQSVDLWF